MAAPEPESNYTSEYKIPDALPHGKIHQIFEDPDVFYVTGTASMAPMRFARTMTIVRDKGELTLISAVRLDEAGLAALEELGEVKHIVKIAHFHGSDDPFYIRRYKPTTWALEGARFRGGHDVDEILTGTNLPFSKAELFVYHNAGKLREAAFILRNERAGNVLISGDAVQNWISNDNPYTNGMGAFMCKQLGFVHPMGIGPGWVASAKTTDPPVKGSTLYDDFLALEALDWVNFVSAHGVPVTDGTAKTTFSETLSQWGPDHLNNRYDPMVVAMSKLKANVFKVAVPVLLVVAGVAYWYWLG